MTLLIPADMRRPKPGLELSFHSSSLFATIEAHSERAKKWLVNRFGEVTESREPRLTGKVPNLGFVLVGDEFAARAEAEAANLGFVTQWNPASQEEIDLVTALRSSIAAKADDQGIRKTNQQAEPEKLPRVETSEKKSQ
jgi:hypothetical protein